ncbi:MAG: hypothetical protein WKF84_27820 [Pyrinomonadaceae bacterium]
MYSRRLIETRLDQRPPKTLPDFTPDDIRRVIQMLKKKPEGIVLSDASSEVFEQGKAAAYEWLGIVIKSGNSLKLSPLGWDMARQFGPAAYPFRKMLTDTGQYHSVLSWALRKGLERLTSQDVAGYWRQHYTRAFSGKTDSEVSRLSVCFIDLCQAAALGSVCNSDDAELNSLRLDREELAHFLMPAAAAHPRLVAVERATEQRSAAPGNPTLR